MKAIELTNEEMEILRIACSHMENKEFMRVGERVVLHDHGGAECAKSMALLYRNLWVRLYRLQYGVDPKPLTDAATCTG